MNYINCVMYDITQYLVPEVYTKGEYIETAPDTGFIYLIMSHNAKMENLM